MIARLFAMAARFRQLAEEAQTEAQVAPDPQQAISKLTEADCWLKASGEVLGFAADLIAERERDAIKPSGLCPHGDDPAMCEYCHIESDFQADCEQESRHFGG